MKEEKGNSVRYKTRHVVYAVAIYSYGFSTIIQKNK